MSTAEFFSNSILIEGKGVHIITWEEKGDLIHTLIVFFAVCADLSICPLLLTSIDSTEQHLRSLFEIKPDTNIEYEVMGDRESSTRKNFLLLFLDQAVSSSIGPLLNGWRSALAEPPGTLLIIRSADLMDFQRNAPDLASFIGPRILDTSSMLSVWSTKTSDNLKTKMPNGIGLVLQKLPGENLSEQEIIEWIKAHPPIDRAEDVKNERT